MRFLALVVSPCAACVMFWCAFTACIDSPLEPEPPPIARVLAQWDPLACRDPDRIAVELEDHAGVRIGSSAPCRAGSVTLDAPHVGVYYARVSAVPPGEPGGSPEGEPEDERRSAPLRLVVDEPVVRWWIVTP